MYEIDLSLAGTWERPTRADQQGRWIYADFSAVTIETETEAGERLAVSVVDYDSTDYYVISEAMIVGADNTISRYLSPISIKLLDHGQPRRAIPAMARTSEVAELAGTNRSYVKAEIASGRLHAAKDSRGEYYVEHEALAAWLDNPRRGSRGSQDRQMIIYEGHQIKLRRAHRGVRWEIGVEGGPSGIAPTRAEAIRAAQREIDYALSVEDVGELLD